jgi:hypothetical protein
MADKKVQCKQYVHEGEKVTLKVAWATTVGTRAGIEVTRLPFSNGKTPPVVACAILMDQNIFKKNLALV